MANAGKVVRGLDMLIRVGNKVVGGQRNASIEMSAESIDVTTKVGDGWAETIAGMKSWTCSCDGVFFLDDTGLDGVYTAFLNGSTVDLLFLKFEGASTNTKIGYEGKASITSFNLEASQDDVVSYTISFEGVGALTSIKGQQKPEATVRDVQLPIK